MPDFALGDLLPHPSKPWVGAVLLADDPNDPQGRVFGGSNPGRISILDLTSGEERVVTSHSAVNPLFPEQHASPWDAVLAWRGDELIWSTSPLPRRRDRGDVLKVEDGRYFARWPLGQTDR
ncbi:MAG: hypothetical protein AAF726_21525 [Planctomycetota bacterium]